jgi:branched-chain amino acid transport system permease protein
MSGCGKGSFHKKGERAVDSSMYCFFFLNGITSGMTFFILASGLTLVFGVLRILNLAHGSLFMLGAYFSYQVTVWLGNFWYAIIIAPLICAAIGIILERVLLRSVYNIDVHFQLLLTFGLILVLEDFARLVWGVAYKTVSEPELLQGMFPMLGAGYPRYNLFVILVGILVGIAVWVLLAKTKVGKMVRAASSDREMASGSGINVPRLYTLVFAFGAWLAGLAGVMAAPLRSITMDLGGRTIVEAFAVVVIGGLGSIPGALLGSIVLGQLNAFGVIYLSRFEMAFMYILMAIVLLIRPRGLIVKEAV